MSSSYKNGRHLSSKKYELLSTKLKGGKTDGTPIIKGKGKIVPVI
jgi:hypothetical protein